MRTETVTAYLDHVVVMLDPPAYRDVLDSAALRRFGRFTVKESESSLAGRYTGAALVGRNTLVELFDVTSPPLPGVTGGLVLSFEEPGSSAAARDLLTSAGLPFGHELVRRAVPGEQGMRPWYHLIRPDLGQDNPFLLMVSEVDPDYYAHIGAPRGPGDRLTRSGYLNARLGSEPDPDQPMGDVTEVALRLAPERADRLTAVLTALGYADTGACLAGPGADVVVERGTPEGVRSVRMTVTGRPVGDAEHRFGATSRFRVDATGAEWRFTPQGRP